MASSTTTIINGNDNFSNLAITRSQICDRITDTALIDLAVRAGFRRSSRRGRLGCIHGEDRNPSARIYQGRVKCDSCGGKWSPVDLVMLSHGCGYVEGLKVLAVETGVPWPTLSAAERERLQRANAAAPQLARDIADWASGISLWAEQRKSDLVEVVEFALKSDSVELARHFNRQIDALRPALSIRSMNPSALARAFADIAQSSRSAVRRFIDIGRGDREHAELVTAGIIQMLAVHQHMDSPVSGRVN